MPRLAKPLTREQKRARLTPAQRTVIDRSQWLTEPWLADVVAQIAQVRGKRVLEPSCGDGEIVRACLDAGAKHIDAVELDGRLVRQTWRRFTSQASRVRVQCADFLAWDGKPVDVVACNVPYENGADAAHVERALCFAPRLVGVLRLNALAGAQRYERLWSRFAVCCVYVLPQRPDFGREARRVGLVGSGAESDFVVVDVLSRPPRPGERAAMEWLRRPST